MNYYDNYIKYNQNGGSNDDYKIIKEIGIGMMGTVYLVKDKSNNKYAMKIEKILKKHSNESLEYDIWREIEFSNKMYK